VDVGGEADQRGVIAVAVVGAGQRARERGAGAAAADRLDLGVQQLGHVLELGTTGREVRWSNPAMRQSYVAVVSEVTPGARIPGATGIGARDRCRVLVLTTATGTGVTLNGARGQAQTLVACQANPGVWSIR